ncbi:MAG: cytochrome c biogenesis protein CcsA [Casimicrobiaceae bacterium]
MILLHLVLTALYGFAAWAMWPAPAHAPAGTAATSGVHGSGANRWLIPLALVLHAWLVAGDVAKPGGLDLSFGNALSMVAGLTALVAWITGQMRTLPIIGAVVLPMAGIFALLPVLFPNPHTFAYAEAPWAAAHVAVALTAYALFLVAAAEAVVLMWLEKRLHRGIADASTVELPPLLTLERLLFRLLGLGFVLLTLTLVSGIFFSEEVFGRPLTFNHKTVFSILAWFVFGGLLLGRRQYGWRGRVALRWILTGTTLLFLAYLGSKFVLEVVLHR